MQLRRCICVEDINVGEHCGAKNQLSAVVHKNQILSESNSPAQPPASNHDVVTSVHSHKSKPTASRPHDAQKSTLQGRKTS